MRNTGIPLIGDVPWGAHFCQFYENEQDLVDILVPYFAAGLRNNEFCMWVTSEPLRAEEARAALSRHIHNLDEYFHKGQIEILEHSQWYTLGGKFESGRVLAGWVNKLEAAQARGFDGLRLSGNTFWLEKPDWQDFTDYEATVDTVIGRYRMLALCTYSLARCGALEIMDVVSNHAFALIKRAGRWQLIESAERRRIEATLRQSRHSLDLALEAAELGAWDYHFDTGDVFWDDRCRGLFGVAAGHQIGYQQAIACIHPDDRAEVDRAVNKALAGEDQGAYHQEFRVVWPDGSVHWVASHGRVYFEDLGALRRAVRLIGVNADITEQKSAEAALRQQREWLRVTLTSIGDAVLAIGTDGRVTFLNPVAAALTGWTEKEALGRPVREVFRIINEQTRREAEDIVARVIRERKVALLANHTVLIARDGREVPIEDSAAPITDNAGNIAGAVVVFHDVTEKRRAEEALRQSEHRVRVKLESILSPEGDIGNLELRDILDIDAVQALMEDLYRIARIPMAIVDLKGKVLVGVGWQDVCVKFHRVQPDACRHCIESDTELSAGVAPGEFKLYKCKNNLWDMATPLLLGGQHVGNMFTGQFFLKDEPVDYSAFRSQAERYGFPQDEYLAALQAVPRLTRKDVNAGMAFLAKLGQLLSMLSFSNLKLARAVAEREALTASLNRAQEIARLGSWELDLTTGRLSWSDEVYRIFGWEPREFGATYQAFLEAVHPDDRAAVDAAYSESLRERKTSYEIDHRVMRRNTGEVRWVHEKCEHLRDASGAVVRSVGMVQDITERKRAEEQLRQAQKLESIGLLAGGIAHDFNNLLVGVIGNASLAGDMLPYESPAAEVLRRIVKSGEQAAHLTRQMLAYAGKGRFILEPVDLSGIIRETSMLIQGSISKKIALRLDLAAGAPRVESDPSQMQQVFMNLALNAAEAIGGAAGIISVSTGEAVVDAAYIAEELHGWSVTPGRYVYLEVGDTGCGMDQATAEKIFDPFFTTKFQGRGLGLAAVSGIVRAHKGAIQVSTAPGKGAAFRVLLPAMTASPAETEPDTRRLDDLAGQGTILVVDDEEIVRDLARRALEHHGYRAMVAAGGAEAIDILRDCRDRIQLVVLDLSMPGMSGEETLPELRRLNPNLQVIVSSGHSESEALRPFDGLNVSHFIQKPYTVQALARKVKSVLEQEPPPALYRQRGSGSA